MEGTDADQAPLPKRFLSAGEAFAAAHPEDVERRRRSAVEISPDLLRRLEDCRIGTEQAMERAFGVDARMERIFEEINSSTENRLDLEERRVQALEEIAARLTSKGRVRKRKTLRQEDVLGPDVLAHVRTRTHLMDRIDKAFQVLIDRQENGVPAIRMFQAFALWVYAENLVPSLNVHDEVARKDGHEFLRKQVAQGKRLLPPEDDIPTQSNWIRNLGRARKKLRVSAVG